MFSCAPECSKRIYCYENILQIGEVLWHHVNAKISPKAASEKVPSTVSENRYTSLNIDVFRTAILMLLAPTGNNAWVGGGGGGGHLHYTRYCLPPLQSGGIAECLCSFPSAFERPSVPVVQ